MVIYLFFSNLLKQLPSCNLNVFSCTTASIHIVISKCLWLEQLSDILIKLIWCNRLIILFLFLLFRFFLFFFLLLFTFTRGFGFLKFGYLRSILVRTCDCLNNRIWISVLQGSFHILIKLPLFNIFLDWVSCCYYYLI